MVQNRAVIVLTASPLLFLLLLLMMMCSCLWWRSPWWALGGEVGGTLSRLVDRAIRDLSWQGCKAANRVVWHG